MTTVYISVGNSDDRLSQREWHDFYCKVSRAIHAAARRVHGQWVSEPAAAWQNACWCVELADETLKYKLAGLAAEYRQDSIAWAVAATEFIGPAS